MLDYTQHPFLIKAIKIYKYKSPYQLYELQYFDGFSENTNHLFFYCEIHNFKLSFGDLIPKKIDYGFYVLALPM